MATPDRNERRRTAAEALAVQRRGEVRRRRLNIVGVVGVVLALVVVAFVFTRSRSSLPDTPAVSAPAIGASDHGVSVGPEDAPHTVVVYEDFLCPFCGELEAKTHDELETLAAQGAVRVEYRPFHFLDADYSEQAANAFKVVLDASGAEVALAFHDALFADQPEESGPFPDDDWLVEKAVAAGATESAVRPGIEGLSEEDWVAAATAEAKESGVDRTPIVLLDGTVFTEGETIDEVAAALLKAVS